MKRSSTNRRGQALVMVTLSLVAMCGILGLAVDLGWSYFVRRNAQAYADAGALAAAQQAFKTAGQAVTSFTPCPTSMTCTASSHSCSSGVVSDPNDNLDNGCLYLKGTASGGTYSGFVDGGNGGRTQTAKLDAGVPATPTSPCSNLPITCYYWVTARVSENIPQLFSAVLGNTNALVSARATAAIVGTNLDASIVLTNRQNDTSPVGKGGGDTAGVDMYVGGSGNVTVPSQIRIASTNHNPGSPDGNAGQNGGSATITAAGGTVVRTPGKVDWTPYVNKNTNIFDDPFGGRRQPPAPSSLLPDCQVIGGIIRGTTGANPPLLLAPGNYYTVDNKGKLGQIQIQGNVRFTAAASATPADNTQFTNSGGSTCMQGAAGNGSGFGDFIFWGGLNNKGGQAAAVVEPGRYFMAGLPSTATNVLDIGSNMTLKDLNNSVDPAVTNAGEIFVVTDANYTGTLKTQYFNRISALTNASTDLGFGPVNIQGGNAGLQLQLHGLTPGNSIVDDATKGLQPFESVLFWQDQRNSRVVYTGNGDINFSSLCGGVDINTPCYQYQNKTTMEFGYQGSAGSIVYGVFYQPRGAWMVMQGGGLSGSNNKTMIVTGALQLQGNSNIDFGKLGTPPIVRIVTLVE